MNRLSIVVWVSVAALTVQPLHASPQTAQHSPAQERSAQQKEEWLNIFIHGALGFKAHASIATIIQARKDCIEGTVYEKGVLTVRKHPYLHAIQPIQEQGFFPVKEDPCCVNASYVLGVLLDQMQRSVGVNQKNNYYTFGWSGLISGKRRYNESRIFYCELKKLIEEYRKKGKQVKVRLIGYSHGGHVVLNFADLRHDEFPGDSFTIDETYLIGMPVTRITSDQIESPIFKKIYHIYSRADIVQRIDVFSPYDFISHRLFKGVFKADLTQIELKISACLRRLPGRCLPSNMRRVIDQSPGHLELWFFGWTESTYRKNLAMYPLSGAVFVPYLVHAAQKIQCRHLLVDIRPDQEKAIVRSLECSFTPPFCDEICMELPFLSKKEFGALRSKAMSFHPRRVDYCDKFKALQMSVDVKSYR